MNTCANWLSGSFYPAQAPPGAQLLRYATGAQCLTYNSTPPLELKLQALSLNQIPRSTYPSLTVRGKEKEQEIAKKCQKASKKVRKCETTAPIGFNQRCNCCGVAGQSVNFLVVQILLQCCG